MSPGARDDSRMPAIGTELFEPVGDGSAQTLFTDRERGRYG